MDSQPPTLLDGLPCVDMSNFDLRREDITKDLMHAGTKIGFFYVRSFSTKLKYT
jgi:isopenicillin N synthase-like dioxygenase